MRLSKKVFRITVITAFFIGFVTQLFFGAVGIYGTVLSKYLTFTVVVPLYVVSLLWFFNHVRLKSKILIILVSMLFSVLFGEIAMILHPLLGGAHTEMYGLVFLMVIPFSLVFGLITGTIISFLLDRF